MNSEREKPESGEGAAPGESIWSKLPIVVLMALVLLVTGLLSALTAMRFAIQGQEVVVPRLTGLGEAEARRALDELGLDLTLDGVRFSAEIPEGAILDQTPAAGTRVKQNRAVRALVSLGERQHAVPDVKGASLRSAQLMLTQRGFSVGGTLFAHSGEGAEGTVLFQWPEAGDLEGADPAVDLLVSLGPADEYYIMPNFIGQRSADVMARIRREGFRLGDTTPGAQPAAESGRVVRQQPPAGFRVSRNDLIFLEVSP